MCSTKKVINIDSTPLSCCHRGTEARAQSFVVLQLCQRDRRRNRRGCGFEILGQQGRHELAGLAALELAQESRHRERHAVHLLGVVRSHLNSGINEKEKRNLMRGISRGTLERVGFRRIITDSVSTIFILTRFTCSSSSAALRRRALPRALEATAAVSAPENVGGKLRATWARSTEGSRGNCRVTALSTVSLDSGSGGMPKYLNQAMWAYE